MAENFGRSFQSDNDYLNQSFLYIENTSIRADWQLIRQRLITALNASDSSNSLSFEQWVEHARQHYSLSASLNSLNKEWRAEKKAKDNAVNTAEVHQFNKAVNKCYKGNESANALVDEHKRLIDEQREADQAKIAQAMLTWLAGKHKAAEIHDYPYVEKIQNLGNLRQAKGKHTGSLSFKAISDLRNDFDSHMYWLNYIQPYLASKKSKAIPPRPGAHKPYVSRGVLELVHELDGLINIIMTIVPTFAFPELFKLVPYRQLELLLGNSADIPNGFVPFKDWLIPEIKLAKKDKIIKAKLNEEVAKLWFCLHWVNIAKGGTWYEALLSIYEGQVEELFLSLIEASKQSEVIKLQLENLGVVSSPEMQALINSASTNLSAFVQANYDILQQEQVLKSSLSKGKAKLTEYETLFLSITNKALQKRALSVGRSLSKRKLLGDTKNQKLDRYTRVKKSTSIATRMMPFIFYYSDMKKRYHHWFASAAARIKAEHEVKEKLDFAKLESGESEQDELSRKTSEAVDELAKRLFSFTHINADVKELKNMMSAALVQKYYCCQSCDDKDVMASVYCPMAVEQQLILMNMNDREGWNDIVNNVHQHLTILQKKYVSAGFDSLEDQVNNIAAQFLDFIVTHEPAHIS